MLWAMTVNPADRRAERGSELTDPPAGASAICPYLVAADRAWRAASPSREHRCTAVEPAAPLALDKQRRTCLTGAHRVCPTYLAAREAIAGSAGVHEVPRRWSIARTAPVVIERGGPLLAVLSIARDRAFTQLGLVALMAVALGAVVVARLPAAGSPGGDSQSPPLTVASASPEPSRSPEPSSEPSESPAPSASPQPTEPPPSGPSPVPSPTASPSPSATYQVKFGDTLSGIAARFGTTVRVLAELNGIADPSLIRVGQILVLP